MQNLFAFLSRKAAIVSMLMLAFCLVSGIAVAQQSAAGDVHAAALPAPADPGRAVNFMRIRINPALANAVEGVLLFDIDGDVSAQHVRNSIAEYVPNPDTHYRQPEGQIQVSVEAIAEYFRGEISAAGLLASGSVSGRAGELLGLFDEYERAPLYPYTRRVL